VSTATTRCHGQMSGTCNATCHILSCCLCNCSGIGIKLSCILLSSKSSSTSLDSKKFLSPSSPSSIIRSLVLWNPAFWIRFGRAIRIIRSFLLQFLEICVTVLSSLFENYIFTLFFVPLHLMNKAHRLEKGINAKHVFVKGKHRIHLK